LICEKEVVRELIQKDCNPVRLRHELDAILQPERRRAILEEYRKLRGRLDSGDPGKRVADHIVATLKPI
jgi:lipid-A-disaccharide synthase